MENVSNTILVRNAVADAIDSLGGDTPIPVEDVLKGTALLVSIIMLEHDIDEFTMHGFKGTQLTVSISESVEES